MTEAIILGAGILLGGLGIAYGLQARRQFHERDEMRRFQEAMRAAGRPSAQKRRK
ncbi:MAG: hypothetical protein ABFD94_14060 [Armatimonadia bacterium]|jgi:hypothetical protein